VGCGVARGSEADRAAADALGVEAGHRQGLLGGVGGEQRDAAHGAGLLARPAVVEVEVDDARRGVAVALGAAGWARLALAPGGPTVKGSRRF
jgi:hypothetical protein